jgi:L-amino acid N-acyltransferase YncA
MLRFVSLRDAQAIAAIYAPVVTSSAISFELVAPDAAEMYARIGRHPADKPWVVAAIDGGVAGYAYASDFRGRPAYRFGVEVTCYVAEHARGRGIGKQLYAALIDVLVLQGYRRAFAGITLPNTASVALHRAMGFGEAGVMHAAGFKLGQWHDVAFYELALGALDTPAHDPLPIEALDPESVRDAFSRAGTVLP